VLVLCCGSDRSASDVARWMGVARVIGVDHNLTLLRDTQQSPLDPGLAYVRADDGTLPFQDGSVGAVLAMGGLHQASAPLGLVAEAGRVLAPGGSFVGASHLDRGPAALRWLTWAAGEPAVPQQDLVDAMEAAGLEMLSLQVQGITGLFAARRRP
jgi:ubiquinone/menaquinone biosynthesis C-methylase UbiE